MNVVNYNDSHKHDLRIDKNIAFNILSFREFKDDAKLLKAIAIYMAINHQEEDLFGFHRLDPKIFAKYMYFNTDNLFRKHPSPFFIENDPNADKLIENEQKHGRMSYHRTWSTYFENALYILTHKTLINDYRISKGNKEISNSKRFNFIDEIRFELVKSGKTKKIMYYYKPNKAYIQNLQTYFLNTNIDIYTALKKPKLDDAYLHLLNWINNYTFENLNSIIFSIDSLANILDVGKYVRFSNYKRKVTEKFEVLKEMMISDVKGLKLTWINPNDNTNDLIERVKNNEEEVNYENVAIVSWERKTNKVMSTQRGEIAHTF